MSDSHTNSGEVALSSYGNGEAGIRGLTEGEIDSVKAAMAGLCWIRRGDDGRLQRVDSHLPLPSPTDDDMLPFWYRLSPECAAPGKVNFDRAVKLDSHSPSIIVWGVCGYGFSAESYKHNAGLLEKFGFICLRSRRDQSGMFWEKWLLLGTWAAKAELSEAVKKVKGKGQKAEVEAALSFLSRKVALGSLDVVTQRMGLAAPD